MEINSQNLEDNDSISLDSKSRSRSQSHGMAMFSDGGCPSSENGGADQKNRALLIVDAPEATEEGSEAQMAASE